jgi:hypothetical protein
VSVWGCLYVCYRNHNTPTPITAGRSRFCSVITQPVVEVSPHPMSNPTARMRPFDRFARSLSKLPHYVRFIPNTLGSVYRCVDTTVATTSMSEHVHPSAECLDYFLWLCQLCHHPVATTYFIPYYPTMSVSPADPPLALVAEHPPIII